jgi:hypothetical protein
MLKSFSVFLEVEGCYQALFSVIYSLGDESSESPAIIRSIISKLTSNKTAAAKRRLNALVVLFNLTFSVESKLEILNGNLCSFFSVYLSVNTLFESSYLELRQ